MSNKHWSWSIAHASTFQRQRPHDKNASQTHFCATQSTWRYNEATDPQILQISSKKKGDLFAA